MQKQLRSDELKPVFSPGFSREWSVQEGCQKEANATALPFFLGNVNSREDLSTDCDRLWSTTFDSRRPWPISHCVCGTTKGLFRKPTCLETDRP